MRNNRRIVDHLKIVEAIDDVLATITEQSQEVKELTDEAEFLQIINKVQMNRFLNKYFRDMLTAHETLTATKNKLAAKVGKAKLDLNSNEVLKAYVDTQKLENEHLKALTEFANLQVFKLNEVENEIILVYRSLEPPLQLLMYKALLEFCRKCPEIRKVLEKRVKTNQILNAQEDQQ